MTYNYLTLQVLSNLNNNSKVSTEEKNEVENDNTRVDAVLVEPISQTVKYETAF